VRSLSTIVVAAALVIAPLPGPFVTAATAVDPHPYVDAVSADAPAAYWRMDETGGDTVLHDASGNARHGTYAGSPTQGRADGLYDEAGSAVAFNGSSQSAGAPADSAYQGTTASVEVWFRTTDRGAQEQFLFSRGGSFGQTTLSIDAAKHLAGSARISGTRRVLSGTADVAEGRWHHAALTYDGTTLRLYLDGAQAATFAAAGSLDAQGGAPPEIAAVSNSSGGKFPGDLDEIAFYDHALTASRVGAHHDAAGIAPRACDGATDYQDVVCASGPTAYYPLDSTDSIARDVVVPSQDGTYLNGATTAPGAVYAEPARLAARLDGSNDEIAVGYDPYGRFATPRGSVEAWFRLTTWSSADRYIVTRGGMSQGPLLLGMRNGSAYGRAYVNATGYDLVSQKKIDDRKWHHLAITYDGTNLLLYVDGAQESAAVAAGALPFAVNEPVAIGYATNSSAHTGGDVDEVAFYDRALTEEEVIARVLAVGEKPYSCTAPGAYGASVCESRPVGYWTLNESPVSPAAADSTSNANPGTPENGWRFGRYGVSGSAGGIPPATDSPRLRIGRDPSGSYDTPYFSVEAWLLTAGTRPWFETWFVSQVRNSLQWAVGVQGDNGPLIAELLTDDGVRHRLTANQAHLGEIYSHVALTYDGSVIRLYQNGEQVASETYAGRASRCYDVAPCLMALGVPTNTGTSSHPMVDIDEVALYDRALDPAEVVAHAATGYPRVLALAQTYGPTGSGDYADNPTGCCGDPVNTATGSFFDTWHDVTLPGAGVTLDVARSYNSADPSSGPFGTGWTHAYQTSLATAQNGDVTLRAGSGQQVVFHPQPGGGYAGDPGVRATLVHNADGTFTVTSRSQEVLTFDASGRLTAQQDRSGTGLAFAYSGGVLSTVTDAAGRVTTFAYSGGLVSSVTLADGRHADYGYTSGRLTSVTDLRGKTTTYAYDAGGRLASATDPLGHQPFRNTYDVTTGRLLSQLDARNGETQYTWDPDLAVATVTDPRGGVTKHMYSKGGVLLRVVSPVGATTSYQYDDALNVVATTDARGHRWAMTYDARGNLLTRTAPAPLSYVETYTYNTRNDPLTAVDRRGHTTTHTYDATGRVHEITDRESGTTTFTYNARGQLATAVDARNGTTTFGYDAAGNRTSVLTPLGNKTTWAYDASGRMTSMVEARGNVTGAVAETYRTHYTYDAANHLLTVTDPLDRTTTNTYDDAGRLSTVTDTEQGLTTYGYDAADNVTSVTAPDLTVRHRTYDASGNLASSTTALGNKTTHTYDAANRRTSTTTPRGNAAGADPAPFTWTYGYDAAGNRTTTSHPAAGTTTVTFDNIDRPVATRDALGHVTAVAYDGNGNQTAVTDALSKTTSFSYDDLDRTVTVEDPLGHTTTTEYDAVGNQTRVTTELGHVARWTYDADQRLASTIEPRGNVTGAVAADYTTTYDYDVAGRLTAQHDPLGNVVHVEYDPAGSVSARVDANNHRVEYQYDGLDRLVEVAGPGPTSTSYDYDAVGNLVARTDAKSHVTQYDYDADRRLTEVEDPLSRRTVYGYDRDGHVTSRETPLGTGTPLVSGDGTVGATYDALGRLTAVDYSDATPDVQYAYDLLGRVTGMSDEAGRTTAAETYTYDAVGRLKTVGRNGSGFTYGYDDAGRLTSRAYPDGTVVDQGYDADDRVTSLTTGGTVTTLGYDVADRLTATTFPASTGSVESRVYDRAGRLTEVATTQGTTVVARHARTLDPAGNPLSKTTTRGLTGTTETYQYDSADRLAKVCFVVSCATAVSSIAYAYDGVGNRSTETRTGTFPTTMTYTYDAADQLTGTSVTNALTPLTGPVNTTYANDANGRQTAAGSRTFAWGLDDLLSSTTSASTTTAYTYDGAGRRLSEATNGTVGTRYAWDLAGDLPMLATESNAAGATVRRYVNGPEGAVSMATGAGVRSYYVHDPIGSVTDVVGSAGATQWRYDYDPFGAASTTTQVDGAAAVNPVRFAGEYLDAATGQYHLRARQYDPALGRMLSSDPVAPRLDDPYVSAYVYANDRPTLLTDPSGLSPGGDIAWAIGAGVLDAGKDLAKAVNDLVTNPTEIEHQLEQVYVDAGEGLAGRVAVFNQFNPMYHLMVRGDAYNEARKCGNLREAVRQATHIGVIVGSFAGAARATAGAESTFARLRSRLAVIREGGDIGAVGPGVGALRFAKRIGLSADDPAVVNRSMTVQEYIGKFRKGSVLRKFPTDMLGGTVEEALRTGDSTVRKLLTDRRFSK
jgi:RHS repeat-associated protein